MVCPAALWPYVGGTAERTANGRTGGDYFPQEMVQLATAVLAGRCAVKSKSKSESERIQNEFVLRVT